MLYFTSFKGFFKFRFPILHFASASFGKEGRLKLSATTFQPINFLLKYSNAVTAVVAQWASRDLPKVGCSNPSCDGPKS